MNKMHSFTFRAVGNLARNPEAVADKGGSFTRFCLVSNDTYQTVNDRVSTVTSAWFVAVGVVGDEIVRHSRKGDQLFVEGIVLSERDKDGFDFMVTGYRRGAKRRPPGASGARPTNSPPPTEPQEAAIAVAKTTDGL